MTTSITIDEIKNSTFNSLQRRVVITAGAGFFTDAYDLFIIGMVTTILKPLWHLTSSQLALLNSASLISAALGAYFFGNLADKFGRKKMYGVEILILFFGALLSAVSANFVMLLVARIIVGFGIGGDYPTSAVIASEFSGRKHRGYLVLLVFAMQAIGLIVGPMVAAALLMLHVDMHLAWRILLGLGAIPAAAVFFQRRKISETPYFAHLKNIPLDVSHAVTAQLIPEQKPKVIHEKLFTKKWFKYLVVTAGTWFLLDVAFYGNGISAVLLMKTINPEQSLLQHTLMTAALFICFAAPGYILSAKYIDKIGRKLLQITGFLMITLCYFGLALFTQKNINEYLIVYILIFGLSFFFVNFGPNTTTFLIPSEVYPTRIRAKAHGFSAAIGKLGAFVGAFGFPLILQNYGMKITMDFMAIICVFGALITLLIPEMKNKSLEI